MFGHVLVGITTLLLTNIQRLVILGSFGIKVREGEATIAGAVLTPADDIQWVHAPHCHAVPVLRTTDDTVLELQSHPAAKGLRQLGALNPAFARIWGESPHETNTRSSPGTYQIVSVPFLSKTRPLCTRSLAGLDLHIQ